MTYAFVLLCGILTLGFALPGCSADPVAGSAPPVYVLPNPATLDALEEFAREFPDPADPSGLRLVFYDLPVGVCEIAIHDLGGELIREFRETITTSDASASWNLVAHYGRRVPTGTYHWVVTRVDDDTTAGRGSIFISADSP